MADGSFLLEEQSRSPALLCSCPLDPYCGDGGSIIAESRPQTPHYLRCKMKKVPIGLLYSRATFLSDRRIYPSLAALPPNPASPSWASSLCQISTGYSLNTSCHLR